MAGLPPPANIHAGAVLVGEAGLIIRGASGAGKSALILDLIDAGAKLVADDRVLATARHGRLVARCPEAIAGLIEIRGQGIVRVPYVPGVVVRLVVDLVEVVARLPEAVEATTVIEGIVLPRLALPREAPAKAARIRLALKERRDAARS